MIFIAGISIALFISALLLVKKDKSKSDIILMLWMILNALHLSFFYLFFNQTIYDYPYLLGLKFPMPLLHGVLLYYYVSTVTNHTTGNRFILLLHLLPTILTILYLVPFFMRSSEEKIEIFKSGGEGYLVFQQVLLYAVFLSGVVYVVWSSQILRKHKKRIRNEFSSLEDINLRWLQLLIYGLGTVWSLVILTRNDNLIFMGVSVFVILVGFFGIQQKSIFKQANVETKLIVDVAPSNLQDSNENELTKEKYSKSGLTIEKENQYYKKLNQLVIEEKIYTNSELSLNELASKLVLHPNYLSQIINKKENKTFYDYINAYRVEEFKRLVAIPENQQLTLVAIAYDCGFNSKSTFNRYFKKLTGITPSQYVKPLKS